MYTETSTYKKIYVCKKIYTYKYTKIDLYIFNFILILYT